VRCTVRQKPTLIPLIHDMTSAGLSPSGFSAAGQKRQREETSTPTAADDNIQSPHPHLSPAGAASASSAIATIHAFRNVSACNRCRLRKNRCDQKLPACTACEKAHVKCVGYDPITKREIPRRLDHYVSLSSLFLSYISCFVRDMLRFSGSVIQLCCILSKASCRGLYVVSFMFHA
jgi:Fungal Zn(2)-Cys(6) binuclear cluster domain